MIQISAMKSLASQSNSAFIRVSQRSTKETKMTTQQTIPATQNEAFMWSKLLCGVHGRGTADGLCQG